MQPDQIPAAPLPAHMQGIAPAVQAPEPSPTSEAAPQVVDTTSDSDRAWAAEGATADAHAEVVAELADIPAGSTPVAVGGRVVHILDPRDWFSTANTALQFGDWDSWAEMCLAPGEYQGVWLALNGRRGPRTSEVEQMFEDFRALTGATAGKALSSAGSFKRSAAR